MKGSGKPGESCSAPAGLLGGESAVRSRLADATKEDELLAKTMQKPYRGSRKSGNRGNYQKSKGDFYLFYFLVSRNSLLLRKEKVSITIKKEVKV